MPDLSRFCASCGAVLMPSSEIETVAIPLKATPVSPTSIDEGRFPAGTLLAERYRVIGLLGRGGMGEVYRANDLKLGQPVALKFLPEATARNEKLLARFHGEVRIARQVSHPNVCRVYDIGEVEGAPYISMEYVDGEDLGSLLRRIGRLPGDKALEIARKLCAGLAAAHDKGVLHRDLKPANVMIDGRGQVLITDFGLAGLVGQVEGDEIRNGTPAYMAPEQLAGKEVSVRSDIYALGLVLYEMFTGKRAFEDAAQRTTPTSVSTLVKDIDPVVERVILRCLDAEPRNRPASALAVAAALPGGDPLAAALAAGETPSPEMVAAAGDADSIPVRTLGVCLVLAIVGLVVAAVLGGKIGVLQKTPFENSAESLAQKARDLIQRLGYIDRPTDRAYGFSYATEYQRHAEQKEKPAVYQAQLAKGQPPLIYFWYRQSPQYLETIDGDSLVGPGDPPQTISGMVSCNLDAQGRLIDFRAVPPQMVDATQEPARPADWTALLAAAGLDAARFTPAEPKWIPLVSFDARMAWTGSHSHAPDIPLRIEAASWRGKPVYFQVIGPWTRPDRMQPFQQTAGQRASQWLGLGLLLAVFGAAALLAWRNFRLGRGDRRGASRLAAFALGCSILRWLCSADHVPTLHEFDSFLWAAGSALFAAGIFWVLYMALEPYVRRRWPQSLISWSRLLGGGVRDPLVGGHLLIGVALGLGFTLLFFVRDLTLEQYGSIRRLVHLECLLDTRHVISAFVSMLAASIAIALTMFFLFFLVRALLRRQWLAAVVFILLFSGTAALGSDHPAIAAAFTAMQFALALFILIRFGVLPMTAGIFVSSILPDFPVTTDFSAWYAGSAIFALMTVLALAAYSFRIALAGRPLFKEGFLEN